MWALYPYRTTCSKERVVSSKCGIHGGKWHSRGHDEASCKPCSLLSSPPQFFTSEANRTSKLALTCHSFTHSTTLVTLLLDRFLTIMPSQFTNIYVDIFDTVTMLRTVINKKGNMKSDRRQLFKGKMSLRFNMSTKQNVICTLNEIHISIFHAIKSIF